MEEQTKTEVKVTHVPLPKSTTFTPSIELRENVIRPQTKTAIPAIMRKEKLGRATIVLAMINAFFSIIAFSLDHAVRLERLHRHIFSEFNLILTIILIIALVFVYFHPKHKWIYYSIICTSIVFILLTVANFIFHIFMIYEVEARYSYTEIKVSEKLLKIGAAFTILDGIFKTLISIVCFLIVK